MIARSTHRSFCYSLSDWAQHGICGRGVFLDLVNFFTEGGSKPLPYDPWTTHAVTLQDIEACAQKEGVTFRQGDILILRVGWMQKWYAATQEERDALSGKPETAWVFILCPLEVVCDVRLLVPGLSRARK